MKKLLLFIFLLISAQFSNAQSKSTLDKDKVLDYFQNQQYAEAAAYLQGIYKENSTSPKELNQLAYAYLMAGKLPEAEKNYLKLYSQKPNDPALLLNLANINTRRGNTDKAKGYLQEILKTDSTNFNAIKQMAFLSKEDRDTSARINYLKKANVLNPTDADVVSDLSELYFKQNAFQKAEEILEPALNADSSNLQLLKLRMPINIASKKYKEAVQTGETLLSYGDSSSFVLNNLAKSHFLLLQYQPALNYYLKINKDTEDQEMLFYNISLSYRGIKDYKNAVLYLQKTIKEAISPKTASYYGLLGDSFENINKNEEANTVYKRGLLFENNGNLYYNIALLYETKLNDKKNAISYYNQYLKTIDPQAQPKLISFIKSKIDELKR